jgi:hypothetical protein
VVIVWVAGHIGGFLSEQVLEQQLLSQAVGNTVGTRGPPSESLPAHDSAEHIDTMHADSVRMASKKVLTPPETLTACS